MSRPQRPFPTSMMVMLAWRNLWRHRRRTLITLSSIAIGFAIAVVMIGLNDGAHNSMVRNAIKLGEGHLTVQPHDYLEAPSNHKYLTDGQRLSAALEQLGIPGRIEPRISLQVLASTANNAVGAALESLSGSEDARVAMLKPQLVKGKWLQPNDRRGILIGDGMARKLKARIGSKIVLMAGRQNGDSQAQLGRVRGIFDSRVDELDNFLVLANLPFSQLFLEGEGADLSKAPVTRFAIFLDETDTLLGWQRKIAIAIEDEQTVVLNWQEMMPQLMQFIALDDAGNYIFLTLILIMVGFGILNTVLMSVLERTREFGLLRALGLNRRHLLMLVCCETLLLSLLAAVTGWLVGGSLHLWFAHSGIDFSSMMTGGTQAMGTFMDPVIRTELSFGRIVQLTAIIFASTIASGIYPAFKAARVTPVEALRT